MDSNPDKFEVLNLDDYQKLKSESDLPMMEGMVNWDHPDIINWDKLVGDIRSLQNGQSLDLKVWSHRSNPDYHEHGMMIARHVDPKPYILVEGYLALCKPDLLKLYNRKYYLDLSDEGRSKRRGKNAVIKQNSYVEKVLLPMHRQFVEPTKHNADVVIDVSDKSIEQVVKTVEDDLVRQFG